MSRSRWRNLRILVLVLGFVGGGAWLVHPASELPDLTLESYASSCISLVEGSEVLQGERVEVHAVILNARAFSPGKPAEVLFEWRRVDKEEACGFELLSLGSIGQGPPLEASSTIDTGALVPGVYEVTVAVDPDNEIPEVDETNNECSTFLTVLPLKPELRPLSLESTPASPIERGETTSLSTEIENTGDSESGKFEVLFEVAPLVCLDPATGERMAVDVEPADETADGLGLSATFLCARVAGTEIASLIADASFVAVGSASVPGLTHGARRTVQRVFDSAAQLDALLAAILLPEGANARDILAGSTPLSVEVGRQLDQLRLTETIYAVRATISPPGGLSEQDPDNNAILGYLTIKPSLLDLPELRPIEITFTQDAPVEWRLPSGPTVGVQATVVNVGGSIAVPEAGSIDVYYYVRKIGSGIEDPWEFAGSYEIGQVPIEEGLNTVSAYREIRFEEPGDYEIRVVVDATGVVSEVNEDNNSIATGLSIQGSELRPTRVELGAAPIRQGDTIEVVSIVENTGRLTADTFTVGFYVDGSRVDTAYYRGGGLAQNEQVSLRGYLDTTDLPPSTYSLRVIVDPDGQLADNDRSNNEMRIPIVVNSPLPRLAEVHPTRVEISPPSPLVSNAETPKVLTISARLRNSGSIDTGHFQVEFALRYRASALVPWGDFPQICDADACLSPFFCVRQDIEDLARASTKVVQLSCPTDQWPAGLYQIRVRVDSPGLHSNIGEVAEQDENNNEMIVGFRIGSLAGGQEIPPTPYPNVVFKTLEVTPTQDIDAREAITILEAFVWNAGQEAAGAFDVTLCWQGPDGACVPTGTFVRVPALAGESEVDLAEQLGTVIAPSTPGAYQLVGIADVSNEIDERGREEDNKTSAHVQVTGMVKPNLTIEQIWFSKETPLETGTSVTAFARVRNLSTAVGSGTFNVRFEQLNGGPVRDVTVDRLGPNGTFELAFSPSTSLEGEFILRVTADVDNVITETDDDNLTSDNTLEASFSVIPVAAALVEEGTAIGGSVRHLVLDPSADILYAASSNGAVIALRHGDVPTTLFSVDLGGGEVTALALVPGVTLYVATEAGSIHMIAPATGITMDEIVLPESLSVTCMTAASDGTVYIGTTSGVLAIDAFGNLAMGSDPVEPILALGIDTISQKVYAMTASSLYALDQQLVPRCVASGFSSTPSALAVGPNAVYVGTEGGTVTAHTLCDGSQLTGVWRYPLSGTLGSAVSAVVVDPRDFDPIYVATEDGRLFALDAFGTEMWTYAGPETSPLSGLSSAPVWDGRTGRIFLVDTSGMPRVLKSSGVEAFPIDAAESLGVVVRSTLIIDDYMLGTGVAARLVRVYYYGGENGTVFMIQTER